MRLPVGWRITRGEVHLHPLPPGQEGLESSDLPQDAPSRTGRQSETLCAGISPSLRLWPLHHHRTSAASCLHRHLSISCSTDSWVSLGTLAEANGHELLDPTNASHAAGDRRPPDCDTDCSDIEEVTSLTNFQEPNAHLEGPVQENRHPMTVLQLRVVREEMVHLTFSYASGCLFIQRTPEAGWEGGGK